MPVMPAVDTLWLTWPTYLTDPALLLRLHALLDEAEQRTADGRRVPEDRRAYLAAHALLCLALARQGGAPPGSWRFRHNPYGRPEVALPEGSGLRFSISHTRSLVACLLVTEGEVGLDVERIGRVADPHGLATRFFAPAEARWLATSPAALVPWRFTALWTLKEAYVKARGRGLSLPVDQCCFTLDEAGRITAQLDPRLGDEAHRWRFALGAPDPAHLLAIARAPAGTRPIRCREVVPTEREQEVPLRWLATSAPVG